MCLQVDVCACMDLHGICGYSVYDPSGICPTLQGAHLYTITQKSLPVPLELPLQDQEETNPVKRLWDISERGLQACTSFPRLVACSSSPGFSLVPRAELLHKPSLGLIASHHAHAVFSLLRDWLTRSHPQP